MKDTAINHNGSRAAFANGSTRSRAGAPRRTRGNGSARTLVDVPATIAALDPDTCYRALLARDRRFDGRFFIAVRTTGIYCRPICPAPTPRAKNVVFFRCAASAEDAGFRACLRCRPDQAPGSWLGTSATVSRALRLIQRGALDGESVPELASRLGIGERHLTRLFQEHLGTTPVSIAQTRRVHFARQVLEQTELPITEVALVAGFRSLRRFHAVVRARFGRTPTQLRESAQRRRDEAAAGLDEDGVALRLSVRPPYDWEGLLGFLAKRAIPGVERVTNGAYHRTFLAGETPGRLTVTRCDESSVQLRIAPAPAPVILAVVERVRALFDLRSDPLAIETQLGADPLLGPLLRARPGVRVPGAWDGFELAVRAILGQQVSVAAATTFAGRIVERCGRRIDLADERSSPVAVNRLFPTPEALANASLHGLGLTGKRIGALQTLARAVRDEAVRLDFLSDPDATVEALCALPGIGPWTAQYIAMRALGHTDAFPKEDLVLRKHGTGAELMARSEAWRPWRSYAVMLLWLSEANGKQEAEAPGSADPRVRQPREAPGQGSRRHPQPPVAAGRHRHRTE